MHKINIQVQVFMVKFIYHNLFYQAAQHLQVYDEPCFRVRVAFYRHIQGKIMPVPVLIGAFAENLLVFLIGPVGPRQPMRCVEILFSCNIAGSQLILNFKLQKVIKLSNNPGAKILFIAGLGKRGYLCALVAKFRQ